MLSKIFTKDFFRDRAILLSSGFSVLVSLVITFRVLTTVSATSRKIATGYTQYGAGSFILGEWHELYYMAVVAVITTVASIFIGARILRIDRSLALTVLLLQNVVLVFLFMVSNALLSQAGIAN